MVTKAPEIDLHGLFLEEALAEVERELNHAFVQEITDRRIRFITGRGPVLHPQVQKYLLAHPLVKAFSVDGYSISVFLEDYKDS